MRPKTPLPAGCQSQRFRSPTPVCAESLGPCAAPWTVAHQAPLSQARVLEWAVLSSSQGPSRPRGEPPSPALAGRLFATGPLGKPPTAACAVFANLCVFLKCHGDSAGPAGPVAWGAVQVRSLTRPGLTAPAFPSVSCRPPTAPSPCPHGPSRLWWSLRPPCPWLPDSGVCSLGLASCWDGALGFRDHELLRAIAWAIVSRVGSLCQASPL